MRDYQQGKIYKVVNLAVNDPVECYVGSTCMKLSRRFQAHKDHWKICEGGSLLYQAMTTYGIENFRIILIEEYPCENNDQLRAREEHHRIQIGAKYNQKRAIVTDEQVKEDKKRNYENNNDTEKEIQRKRDYWRHNKEAITLKHNEWLEKNKDRVRAKNFAQYDCECGGKYIWKCKARHMRSQRHIAFIEQQHK